MSEQYFNWVGQLLLHAVATGVLTDKAIDETSLIEWNVGDISTQMTRRGSGSFGYVWEVHSLKGLD